MIRAAGASFKLRSASTGLMEEVAQWFTDIAVDNDQDRDDANFFNPGGTLPTKKSIFGAITRGYTLTGKWNAAADAFFTALEGANNVPYQYAPEGTAVGKIIRSGSVNIGAWPEPSGSANGSYDSSITMAVNERYVGTIITAPAADSISSSSVADPTLLVFGAAHGIQVGQVITVAGHIGSTPTLDGVHVVTTVPSTTTLTIPVAVTVGGTGGTAQA